MKVKDILNFLDISSNDEYDILNLTDDSAKTTCNSIYICLASYKNAFKYIKEARENHSYLIISKYKIKGTIYVENLMILSLLLNLSELQEQKEKVLWVIFFFKAYYLIIKK